MGDILEASVIGAYRVLFEKNRDSQKRSYFSATVELPGSEQIILDDRILPRLRKTIFEVLRFRDIVEASA